MVDAVAWPLTASVLLLETRESTRLAGVGGAVLFALIGMIRLHTAIFLNARYRFTSWLVLKLVGTLLVLGLALKLFLH